MRGSGIINYTGVLSVAALIGLGLPMGPAFGGEAADLLFFAFNEAGPSRAETVPVEFVDNLAARTEGLDLTRVQAVAWSDVFKARARPAWVTVQVTMGSRIELLALFVDTKGVVRLAARRPASTLFDARMDQGQPGSGEALVNAWRELAADVYWARQRQPAGAGGDPIRLGVIKGDLMPGSAWAIETMALAALAMDGRPAVPAEPADLVIRASRNVVYDLSVEGPTPCLKRSVRQEDLFPALRMTLRQRLIWGPAVSDAHLADPAWEPVAVAGFSTSQVAVTVAGALSAFSAADGRPCAPEKNLSVTSAIPEALRAAVAAPAELPASALLGPLVFGKKTLLLTRSRQALFLDARGAVAGEHLFPDRLHDAVPVCEGGQLKELVLIDAAGGVWTWAPGVDSPVRRIDLRLRPNGPLVFVPHFIFDWNSAQANADEESGGVVAAGPQLLIGTTDGFLIHMPYPIRGTP